MIRALMERLRPLVDGARALEDVRALTGFHRVQASPGYDAAADWLVGRLREAGLSPEVIEVPADGVSRRLGCLMPEGWSCSHARAALIGASGREPLCDYDEQRLSLVLRSAPAEGRFPLVALSDGTEDAHYEGVDVRGRVVLTGGNAYRVHRLAVVERGAAGLLCDGRRLLPPVRTSADDRDSIAYTSFWWAGDEPRGWGFVVSPASGERIRERLGRGEELALDVAIDSRRFATTIPLVSAAIDGDGPGEVLITAHLCHPQPSANDNGSGVAALVETARALASLAAEDSGAGPRLTIRFLWMPEFTGTYAWIAERPTRAAATIAALNLDMVGEDQSQCGSTMLLEHPPHFAASFAEELLRQIRGEAQDSIPAVAGPGHLPLMRLAEVPYSGGSDHAVWIDPAFAVPCPMLIQWPDRFYHSSLDTIDRVDPGSLALAARSAATYAAFLARAGPAEREWLFALVSRGARRRLLASLDAARPLAAARFERERGERALASLAVLWAGSSPPDGADPRLAALVRGASEELDGFFDAEIAPHLPAEGNLAGERQGDARRPVRRQRAPLDLLRHLLAGWDGLTREEREAFRRLDLDLPGGSTALDLAWYACEGQRRIDEIGGSVRLEGHPVTDDQIARFFTLTARMGLSAWRAGEEPR